jgi:lipopolysaccharide biosynthesis glycosyltransferase
MNEIINRITPQSLNANTKSSPVRAFFYVTDLDFALPTLASALEVRRKVPRERADVHIVTTGIPADILCRMTEFAGPYGVQINDLNYASFSGFDHRNFNKTHVPITALGRFFMLDAVPGVYERILYLDGDTWPVGDPLKLLEADLPEGFIGAAEDRYSFRRQELGPVGRKTRAYFAGLGIDPNAGYFSSGVLLSDVKTWRQLCSEAFDFFVNNTTRCLYHDQSALNAVAKNRWVRLAPQWNYATCYSEWGMKCTMPPQILHFAGGDKPWTLPFHPYHQTYLAAFAPLQKLGLPVKQYTRQQLNGLRTRFRIRKLRDTLFVHRKLNYQHTFEKLVEFAAIQ